MTVKKLKGGVLWRKLIKFTRRHAGSLHVHNWQRLYHSQPETRIATSDYYMIKFII